MLTGCAETNEPPVEVVEPDDVTVLPTTGAAPTPTSTTIVVTLPPTTTTSAQTAPPVTVGVSYANCTEVREAGAAPIRRDEPGYNTDLDRDGDGIACEN